MNERIRELALQAGINKDAFQFSGTPIKHIVDEPSLEKFAELIVSECATICNKIYFDNYPDAEDFERSEEGDAIKKHFGVEE